MEKLESKNLEYKALIDDNLEDLIEILTNDDVCKYLPGEKAYSKEVVKNFLNHYKNNFSVSTPNLCYGIYEKNKSKLIGYGGVVFVKELNMPEIMYGLNKNYWNRGYATEAAFRFKQLAIDIKLKKLIGLADINNNASNKILIKVGYNFLKQAILWDTELYMYELTI